ncbi:MAG: hypothetical protein GY839_01565, partial [candidate division Zixibacteria bacterium]|nr:hypothetical protein [candidate division Zixibacteria bacterium]
MKKNTIILLFTLLMFSVSVSSGETIYEVQFNDSDPGFIGCYPSPLLLNNVSITGVVTAVDPDDSSNFYIQDADSLWSGIFVSDAGSNLTPGDSVSFTGEVNEESDDGDGYTYLTSISGLTSIASGVQILAPLVLSTGMLSEDCNDSAEAYEGMLVKISTVDVTQEVDGDGYWMVDDGSGATTISNEYYIFTPVMGETIISITGIASSFSDGSDVYYKIIPRTASDIEA